jgi:hypothetical protein
MAPWPKEISREMQRALDAAIAGGDGTLIRHPGGFWSPSNADLGSDGIPRPYFGTTTVEGLVRRKRMTYTDWKEAGHHNLRKKTRTGSTFPVKAIIVDEM